MHSQPNPTPSLDQLHDALVVVTNPEHFADDYESRRTAWHVLLAARGQTCHPLRLRLLRLLAQGQGAGRAWPGHPDDLGAA
jgi:hypothetical protein